MLEKYLFVVIIIVMISLLYLFFYMYIKLVLLKYLFFGLYNYFDFIFFLDI